MTLTELRAEAATLPIIQHLHRLAGENYLRLMARDKFNNEDWRNLPIHQLEQLRAILLNRRAAQQRAALAERQQPKLTF